MQHVSDVIPSMDPKGQLTLIKSPAKSGIVDAPRVSRIERVTRVCPTCHFELSSPRDHGFIKAGYDEATRKTIMKPCPTCSDGANAHVASREQVEMVYRIFGGPQIPHHTRNWSFENYPPDADTLAIQKAQAFVTRHLEGDEDAKRGLYISGQVGRCKTGLAISMLKEVLASGQTGLFVMTLELMNRIRATFNKGADVTQDDLLEAVTKVPWLVLDDMATERSSPFVLEQFYYIIEKRRSQGKYTIFTSNLSTRDLESYWRPDGVAEGGFHAGMRVVERIREYCDGIAMQGRNQRAKGW